MFQRFDFAGGYWCDALPNGDRLIEYKGRGFDVSGIRVPLPPDETEGLMFPRLTNRPVRRFAGIAHDDPPGRILEWWEGLGWQSAISGITQPVYRGTELVVKPVPNSANGWRYVDDAGNLVSMDQTHEPNHELSQWTEHRGCLLGQGHAPWMQGGIWFFDTRYHRVADGPCSPPNWAVDGERCAISFYVEDVGATIILCDLADLRALPTTEVPIEPPPPPPPPPPPDPKPEPTMTVPNRSAELTAFWQEWNGSKPITDDAEKHRFTAALMARLNALDQSGRWGRKSRAGAGQPISKDTAGYWLGATIPTDPNGTDGKIHAFDLITGSSGAVHWDNAAANGDPLYNNIDARWYPVSTVEPPPPPTDDIVQLRKRLDEMQIRVNQQHEMLIGQENELIKLGDRLTAAEAKLNEPVADVEYMLMPPKDAEEASTLRALPTSKAWGHAHEVRALVVRKSKL